jgi:hypothetical protein
LNANLHDAKLVGIGYEANKCIRLTFTTATSGRVELLLLGVRRFVANHLWEGNIVLDVTSTKFGTIEPSGVLSLVQDSFPDEFGARVPTWRQGSKDQWHQWLQQIEQGHLHVLLVEPSYGADVIAICDDIQEMESSKMGA